MDASIDPSSTEQQPPPPQPFAALTDAELAAQVPPAQANAERLTAIAAELEHRAAEAAEAFRNKPSAASHTASAVASQLAINARAEADRATADAGQLAAAHARRCKLQRVRELAPIADGNALLDRVRARVHARVAALHTAMAVELRALLAELAERNAAAAALEKLDRELGIIRPDRRAPMGLRDVTDVLGRPLADAYARRRFLTPGLPPEFGPPGLVITAGTTGNGTPTLEVKTVVYGDHADRQEEKTA